MQSVLSSAVHLLLAIALIVAPVPVDGLGAAEHNGPAGDSCCGCCAAAADVPQAFTKGTCCPGGGEDAPADEPTSSEPCRSDCGQCPCCTVPVPLVVAILSPAPQTLEPTKLVRIVTASDTLSTRSDEPLLPPPRA